MRILFVGGTGPVGQAAIARLDGHDVAVVHSGAHEAVPHVEHLHGSREELLAPGGPVEGWRPDAVVDTFPGGRRRPRHVSSPRSPTEQASGTSS